MFADRANIIIRSGKGGDGHVSFRRNFMYQTVDQMVETAAVAVM